MVNKTNWTDGATLSDYTGNGTDIREDWLEVLGRTADVRRFLLTVLLTTRYHLTSRPISFANDVFFLKLAKFSDQILAALLSREWQSLSVIEEEGIAALQPTSAWAGFLAQKEMSRAFGANFRRYFRGLNLPWSSLPQVDQMTLRDWPEPDHILISVGPSIGIGDEVIFFELARRLRRAYPQARIETISFHPTVWDLCESVDHRTYESHDQVAPYARAKRLLESDRAMVFFVEFASSPIYRQLETVSGFSRFVYLDTGARVVRMIDQTKPAVFDHASLESDRVYSVLHELLQRIGLDTATALRSRPRDDALPRAPLRVFVNPFSSKDIRGIAPEWWAHALNVAAGKCPLIAEIFCGVNEQTRDYASRIAATLDPQSCTYDLHGASSAPSIANTLQRVMACDALLGIDTFTAHIRNVRSIPSVTVYLGSQWHFWRAPDANILNVAADDDPARVGALLSRLLIGSESDDFLRVASKLNTGVEALRPCDGVVDVSKFRAGLRECRRLGCLLAQIDAEIERIFDDAPVSFLGSLESAVGAASQAEGSRAMQRLLRNAWKTWEDSNFCRYLRFLANSTHAETTDVLRRR